MTPSQKKTQAAWEALLTAGLNQKRDDNAEPLDVVRAMALTLGDFLRMAGTSIGDPEFNQVIRLVVVGFNRSGDTVQTVEEVIQ